jgi:hypothetical protein
MESGSPLFSSEFVKHALPPHITSFLHLERRLTAKGGTANKIRLLLAVDNLSVFFGALYKYGSQDQIIAYRYFAMAEDDNHDDYHSKHFEQTDNVDPSKTHINVANDEILIGRKEERSYPFEVIKCFALSKSRWSYPVQWFDQSYIPTSIHIEHYSIEVERI